VIRRLISNQNINFKNISLILIGAVILSSVVPFQSVSAISVTFDSPKKDLGDGGGSTISLKEGAKL